jgi:hypothetical protein
MLDIQISMEECLGIEFEGALRRYFISECFSVVSRDKITLFPTSVRKEISVLIYHHVPVSNDSVHIVSNELYLCTYSL